MAYVTVDVDVDLYEFNDQDLIDELESRGWIVSDVKGLEPIFFSDMELDFIYDITRDCIPGTLGYEVHLNARKSVK